MRIWHMSGAGNDFAVMDARGGKWDFVALAREICAKLGADGFLALDTSEIADFRLHFYNSDGLRGEMCGNGARCICKFAYDLGLAGAAMTVETDAGLVYGWRISDTQYRVQLNVPDVLDLKRKPNVAYVELGCPGIPHVLQEIPGLAWDMREALRPRAKALRYDLAFPKGTNVTFYTLLDESTVRVLTYERGVEDYTLACGTGCGSLAAVLWSQDKLPGGALTAHNPGGTLKLTVSGQEGVVQKLLLEGPAEVLKVYEI